MREMPNPMKLSFVLTVFFLLLVHIVAAEDRRGDERDLSADIEVLEQQVLDGQREGMADEDLGMMASDLGMICMAAEQYQKAALYLRLGLEINGRLMGPDDPSNADLLEPLATALVHMNRAPEAADAYRQIIHLREAAGVPATELDEFHEALLSLGETDYGQAQATLHRQHRVNLNMAIEPCGEMAEFVPEAGAMAQKAIEKKALGPADGNASRLALIYLHNNYQKLGLSRVAYEQVLKDFGGVILGVDALEALWVADYQKAGYLTITAGLNSARVWKEMAPAIADTTRWAFDITWQSFAESWEPEHLRKMDMAFYLFLEDEALQRWMQDPAHHDDAVEHYIQTYLRGHTARPDNQARAEAYFHHMFQAEIDLKADEHNPVLFELTKAMLNAFQERRLAMTNAREKALQLKENPLITFFQENFDGQPNLEEAIDTYRLWCDQYHKILDQPSSGKGGGGSTSTSTPAPSASGSTHGQGTRP